MYNDADIEMIEAIQASNHAARQSTGREATAADIEAVLADAVSHLHFTGGESSHQAMMSAIEDRPDIAWTSELRDRIQWDAWTRWEREDASML
jgi:hypothetical protein